MVLAAIVRALPVIIGVSVILGGAGVLLGRAQPVEYTAQGRVILSATEPFDPLGDSNGANPTRYVANQLGVMGSRPVLQRAADLLADGTDAQTLAEDLELVAPADTDVLEITTTAPTAQQAADRANAVAEAYRASVGEQVGVAAQAAAEASAADPARVVEIAGRASVYGDGVQVVEEALVPEERSAPRPLFTGLLLAAVGALVTAGLVILRRGEPLAERAVLAEVLGAPVLGSVPVPLRRLDRRRPPPLPDARDFSMVLVGLGYVLTETSTVLMCTGVRRGGEAQTVALGLAAAAAEQHQRVLVVDADTSGHDLGHHLDRRASLPVGALSDDSTPQERVVAELVGLRPAGRRGSVHLASLTDAGSTTWNADALRRGLQRLVASFDVVVLSTGPVSTDPMAFALLREASTVVVVVDELSRTPDLLVLRDRLDLADAHCDGLVLAHPVPTRRRRSPRPAAGTDPEEPAGAPVEAPTPALHPVDGGQPPGGSGGRVVGVAPTKA